MSDNAPPARWEEVSVDELAEVKHGYAFRGEHFRDDPPGDVLLTPANFKPGGGFNDQKFKYYVGGDVPEAFVLAAGNLLVSMTDLSKEAATLGYPAFVPEADGSRFLHNQRLGRVVVRPDVDCDPRFLFYVLCSPLYRHYVLARATGTTVRHTSPRQIASFRFHLPPRDEQQRIAGVLGAIDSRLESNRRVASSVERFLAGLFHAQVLEQQWPVSALSTQLEVVMGQSPPGSSYGPDVAGPPLVQGMGAFGERFPATNVRTSAPTRIARRGDVLMTVRAPVGEVNVADDEYCIGRGAAALRGPHPAYAEQLVRSISGKWRSAESGTIFPAVNVRQVKEMRAPCPPEEVAVAFELAASPLYKLLQVMNDENRTLELIRAALLPKLLSGEMRVSASYLPVPPSDEVAAA